ncbi:conserved protein of unknown function [Pararobbsia alpina]|uniref:hypothetical protein n=1 Tax=Pararobbsia alpina TaxID=621374 RepID=UPI0039A44310
MKALLFWISGFLRCRIISDGDRPYLERYYLFTAFGTRAYLHRFVGSDPDRGVHDHPWPWALAIILFGWYWEQRRSGTRIVRWLNFLTGDTFHRVLLPKDRGVHEVWTIFIHRNAKVKPWGFLRTNADEVVTYRVHASAPSDWVGTALRGRNVGRQPR